MVKDKILNIKIIQKLKIIHGNIMYTVYNTPRYRTKQNIT